MLMNKGEHDTLRQKLLTMLGKSIPSPEPEEESGYAFDYYEVGETPVSCAAIFSQFEKMYAVSSNSNNT